MLWSINTAAVKMISHFLSKSKNNKQIKLSIRRNTKYFLLHLFCLWIEIFHNSCINFIIPQTSAMMRSDFLLILGLFAGSLQQTVVCVGHGVCYEKDEVPVDVDVLYDDDCVDVEGNIYGQQSELQSCCGCFRL